MSGWAIAVMVVGVFAIGTAGYLLEMLITKKQRKLQRLNDDRFWDLMDEFTEKNYTPCVVDDTPGTDAEVFKQELIKTYYRRGQ